MQLKWAIFHYSPFCLEALYYTHGTSGLTILYSMGREVDRELKKIENKK